jgi:arylsulfatase A-like enzyme
MYGGYRYLDGRRPFVSETLQEGGLRTVGYHSNPHLGPEKNYNRGFETFNNGMESTDDANTLKNFVDSHLDDDSRLYSLLRRAWHYFITTTGASAYTKASEISDLAIGWLDDAQEGEPFFMWLHYMDVHYPFRPPDKYMQELGFDPLSKRRTVDLNGKMQERPAALSDEDVEDLLRLYDAEIRYMDHHLGRLLDAMEQRGVLEDTVVSVTADHGEAFGEHGRFGHHPHLYDELLHVPLVFDGPRIEDRAIDQQVSLVDMGPTYYDLVGVESPEQTQGRSLEPLLHGGSLEEQPVFVASQYGDFVGIRTPEWKCFWKVGDDEVEMYDLTADPGETVEVSDDYPDVRERLLSQLRGHLQEAEATDAELPEVEESEEVKRRLEELGYVD